MKSSFRAAETDVCDLFCEWLGRIQGLSTTNVTRHHSELAGGGMDSISKSAGVVVVPDYQRMQMEEPFWRVRFHLLQSPRGESSEVGKQRSLPGDEWSEQKHEICQKSGEGLPFNRTSRTLMQKGASPQFAAWVTFAAAAVSDGSSR